MTRSWPMPARRLPFDWALLVPRRCPIKGAVVARTPHVLQRDLQTHDYQLAYWLPRFCRPTSTLCGLFSTRGEELTAVPTTWASRTTTAPWRRGFSRPIPHRDFSEVKRLTQEIHVLLYERMPLIPLWQLDYHIAIHPQSEAADRGPIAGFFQHRRVAF